MKPFTMWAGTILAVGVAHAAVAQNTAETQASPLPGGASSIVETFEDWQVSCIAVDAKPACVLSQTQNQQNGQRLLDVRLNPVAKSGAANGTLTLPFGLALGRGVTVQVDDGGLGQPNGFVTCLPGGCLVPLSLDAKSLAAWRKGTNIKLMAVSHQGQSAPFLISLKGFGAAFDRGATLGQ
ncbi:invasion associated locus B family protein [Phyllobacterium sp. TAF24]|uniref:invasion associated locus B family protein n=1 Tax=Phyllobacterium sp. TAF24 TaxID=3233068 RepID=UPI003F9A4D6D